MTSLKHLEKIHRIHLFIKNENTGNPKDLAKKLNTSNRNIYCLLDKLKAYGAKINYSRKGETYYYEEDFDIKVAIKVVVMQNGEAKELYGGWYFSKDSFSASNLHGTKLY